MKKIIYSVAVFFLLMATYAQELTATDLLDRSIAYHDPEGKWDGFKGNFFITMESPNRPVRKSKIELDFNQSFFRLTLDAEGDQLISQLKNQECLLSFNGTTDFSEAIAKKNRLSFERASMYKDYYTYLYGLPMKLKDPGTRLANSVVEQEIDGISYWVLKVTYEPEIGGDTWYFYLDKNTYQLQRYQFFHEEAKNDGEYIVLENELIVNGIKMPKDRSWYYNKDNKYLATDYLSVSNSGS